MYDIPILLIFFNIPDKFRVVFDEVKKVKPTILFFYQDGPRKDNSDDLTKINLCREIIKEIDWDCQIHTFYQKENVGCDPSGYIAHSWFFNNVEYGIVLEDDCVPSKGFFDLCKFALVKYANDERICMVSGMNLLGVSDDVTDSYFFSSHGGIWGWASWSRFYKLCDPTYSWLEDEKTIREIQNDFSTKSEAQKFIKLAIERKKEQKPYFETLVYAAARSRHMLEIIPKKNTVMNIGTGNGAHTNDELNKMSKVERRYYYQKTYSFEKPLGDVEVVRNRKYEKLILLTLFDKIKIHLNKIFKR